jgi:DNA-binding SARP family transcriptional activator
MPGGRAELVFAYLAVEHRRSVTRDELANALWPELLPDSWAAALRGVVTDVRRFLDNSGLDGTEMIAGARGGYQLQLPPGVTVDFDDAREGLTDARARLERDDAAGAANAASRAATLTALRFLPRHDGKWVQKIRDELEAIHSAALELGARAYGGAGDTRAARAAAEQLVRVEPYREAAHQLLIEVLGQAGDRAGAIQAYERCRAVLRSELRLEPSAETDAVLQRALAAPARAGPAQGSPGVASLAVLVVEDHDFQRRTALALLRRLGVGTVLEAGDGHAALDLLAKVAPPDVIVCDIDMPGMDGVEFIRHVARRGLASAVAIASGLDRSMLETVRAVGEAVPPVLTADTGDSRRLRAATGELRQLLLGSRPRARGTLCAVPAPGVADRPDARSPLRSGRVPCPPGRTRRFQRPRDPGTVGDGAGRPPHPPRGGRALSDRYRAAVSAPGRPSPSAPMSCRGSRRSAEQRAWTTSRPSRRRSRC